MIDADQPTLELHTQQFVDSLAGAPSIYKLSPAEARSDGARQRSEGASSSRINRVPPHRSHRSKPFPSITPA